MTLTIRVPAILIATALFGAPQQETVFRSNVALVRVDAEVVDASANIVPDLKAEDFRIIDEGVERATVGFSFEREPLDLILLFDTNASMRSKVHQVLRAVELGFHELQKGDRVCVMAFGQNSFEVAPFTADLEAVNAAIAVNLPGLRFGGDSRTAAAAVDAALRFRREPVSARRRAILLIGDKIISRDAGDAAAVRALWQADAVLSELVIGKPGKNRLAPPGANPIPDKTGGATLVAGNPGPAFQDSLRRLRRRYTLYYALPPAPAGSERTIDVQLTPDAAKRFPGATVRARTGYLVRTPDVP